ncbi:hypothetical protein GCM10020254_63920 [Streptomyces goshikiensis]
MRASTVAEVRGDSGQVGGVGDGPEAVAEAVLGGGGEQRRPLGGALDDRGGALVGSVAEVGEQQGFEVGGGGPHQAGAVGDHVGHDVLVGQDDAGGGVGQGQGADHAALEEAGPALLVHVEGGLGVGAEDALGEPVAEGAGGLVVARRRGVGLGEDQADDVVRVRGFEVVDSVGAHDHVVRRGGDGREAAHTLRYIAQSGEGDQPQPVLRRVRSGHWCIVRRLSACGMIGGVRK